MYSII